MPWFKVDDKLHSHKKAARAGTDALGLWVLCGSWAMDHLTDGFVPDYIARRFDQRAEDLAAQLVDAGLWRTETKDGDTGWTFHGWTDMQPTRADVESKRESEREKKRSQRARGFETASRGKDGRFQSVSPGDTDGTTEGLPGVSRGESSATRPDPTRTQTREGASDDAPPAAKRGSRLPEDWIPDESVRQQMQAEFPNLDFRVEHAKFVDHWKAQPGQKGVKTDWNATWRNWIRKSAEFAPRLRAVNPYEDRARTAADRGIPEAWL